MVPHPPGGPRIVAADEPTLEPVQVRRVVPLQVRDGAIPDLPAEGMKNEPARPLARAPGVQGFEGADDPGVEVASPRL